MTRGSVIVLSILLISCSTRSVHQSSFKIVLPEPPPAIVIDRGHIDKDKYSSTKWVKPPIIDNKRNMAWWSFKDVETISRGLKAWEFWYKDVKELIEGHNRLSLEKSDPWYKFW